MIDRSIFITAVIGYFAIRGIVMFVILALLHSFFAQMPPYAMQSIGWLIALADGLIISVAMIQFLMGYLLYSGKSWGRYVIIGLTIYSIINGILNVLTYSPIIGYIPLAGVVMTLSVIFLILDFGVMYLMFRSDTKSYFGKNVKSDPANEEAI